MFPERVGERDRPVESDVGVRRVEAYQCGRGVVSPVPGGVDAREPALPDHDSVRFQL